MRTMLTRRAGAPGTKRLLAEYGEDLVCVRYRYDEEAGQRLKTVEIVVSRVKWVRAPEVHEAGEAVRLRLTGDEDLLRRALLLNGGKWDERTDAWTVSRGVAESLGLRGRILRRRPRDRSSGSQLAHAPRVDRR
ncbi:MAG TPA: hypothetical protein VMM77_06445 [Gemmatimonadaceae bacterium]|nr:hypothetical protein [Gemmatimonadaceae bacterium]